jgi:integrase
VAGAGRRARWVRWVLPIPVPLVSILRAHRHRQRRERVAAGSLWRNTGLVFTTAHGGFIEPRNANRMFHDVCTKANVPQLRVHDLRHSCATLLFTMGVQAATVQRILRHRSITVTTGTCVEVIEAVQRDALDSMGSLFGSAVDPGLTL